jgi:acylphosphatase
MSVTICRVVIRGRVQGVGYRAWLEDQARASDLEGWVRNRRDGSVEAVFAGPEHAVTAAIEACRSGPRGARVAAVDVEEGDASLLQHREGARFAVLRTA